MDTIGSPMLWDGVSLGVVAGILAVSVVASPIASRPGAGGPLSAARGR